jgi:hypothetical protein
MHHSEIGWWRSRAILNPRDGDYALVWLSEPPFLEAIGPDEDAAPGRSTRSETEDGIGIHATCGARLSVPRRQALVVGISAHHTRPPPRKFPGGSNCPVAQLSDGQTNDGSTMRVPAKCGTCGVTVPKRRPSCRVAFTMAYGRETASALPWNNRFSIRATPNNTSNWIPQPAFRESNPLRRDLRVETSADRASGQSGYRIHHEAAQDYLRGADFWTALASRVIGAGDPRTRTACRRGRRRHSSIVFGIKHLRLI